MIRIAPDCRCLYPLVLLALTVSGPREKSARGAERPGSLDTYTVHNATLIGGSRLPADSPPPRPSLANHRPAESEESSRPSTEREFHGNGKVRIAREVIYNPAGKAVPHGVWQWWDESGRLIATGEFRHGKREGAWKRFHDREEAGVFQEEPYVGFAAPFSSEAVFANGLLHGHWLVRDARGRLITSIHYREGLRDGVAIWWSPQGGKVQQIEYRAGLLDGEFVKWDAEGGELFRRGFQDSRELLIDSSSYADGKRRSAITVSSAPLIAEGRDDWWSGNRTLYRPLGRDERQGISLLWHANGQVQRHGDFDQDAPVGTHTWWHVNGQKAVRGDYLNGRPQGTWTWWHANGQELAVGVLQAGVPVGVWRWGRPDGGAMVESAAVAAGSQAPSDRDAAPAPPRPRDPPRMARASANQDRP